MVHTEQATRRGRSHDAIDPPPTGWGDVATRNDLTANTTLLRGEMAILRGEIDIRFSHTNRTIVLAAVATTVSSWAAAFATLGLG